MIAKRLLFLNLILLFGFSSYLLLPTQPKRPDPGVVMELPSFVNEWFGADSPVSEKEIQVLGKDTQFARKVYTNGRGDSIYVSIVLAGEDMNTSIHRPERCLPAQGYTMLDSRTETIDLERPLRTTRLHNRRTINGISGGKEVEVTEFSLDYYWFVGSSETTHDHTARNLMDIRDRLFKGYNQPWAFVSVISRISKGLQPFGRTEEETDKMIKDFLKELLPMIQKSDVVNG